MLFNSYLFWIFFLVVFILYWRLPHRRQNRLLLVASYVFYGAWDWRFLSLIIASTLVDFYSARALHRHVDIARRKPWLVLSILTNLGLLGVFKYFDFFVFELQAILEFAGLPATLPTLQVLLPVGISFYTFQTMSYTIDVYRRRAEPATSLPDFALFVCFFPQLVAGPIERFKRLMPQIQRPRTFGGDRFAEGLHHVLLGLFKKVVIADNLASMVDAVFQSSPETLAGGEVVVGVWAFALQIYGDFSGYSSIAQGIAKWLGFDLMYNFRMPYLATSPSDFWRRWHISLSRWLRDYLYVSIGGNRKGRFKTYRNLLITMVLGGLWHGAGGTYLAWGLFHGLLLCAWRPFREGREASASPWGRALRVVLMFQLVCVGWLLFRAASIEQAWIMASQVVLAPEWTPFATYIFGTMAFYTGPLLALELWFERRGDQLGLLALPIPVRAAAYLYFILMLWFFPPERLHAFIYFQF